MLDARRAKEKGYITLKEAAQLTDYSSDYIGQLIRNGKIKGKQVYCSVAWVTTKEEVDRYREGKLQSDEVSSEKTASINALFSGMRLMKDRALLGSVAAVLACALLVPTLLFIVQVEVGRDTATSKILSD